MQCQQISFVSRKVPVTSEQQNNTSAFCIYMHSQVSAIHKKLKTMTRVANVIVFVDKVIMSAITRERKVKKLSPTWEMNRISEGYKRAEWQKTDFWAKNRDIGPRKKDSFLAGHHVLATTGKKLFKEKECLCPNNQGGKCHFGRFFGVRPIFRPKTTFRPNVKTPVSP